MSWESKSPVLVLAAAMLAVISACGARATATSTAPTATAATTDPAATPLFSTVPSVAPTVAAPSESPTASSIPSATPTPAPTNPVQRAITLYSIGGNQWNSVDQLRPGPDGALWFVTGGMAQGVIGRITTAGVVTTWPIPWPGGSISCFTFGAGFLWSVDEHSVGQSFIGQWTLTGALVAEFPVPETAYAVTWGPDDALWFSGAHLSGMAVSGSFIGRMTLHGVVSQYPMPDASSLAGEIVAGPDGALWFTELPGMHIGRVTTSGDITEYSVPDGVNIGGPIANNQTIVVGSDAELWTIGAGRVATVTTQGIVSVLPSSQPISVTSNADGDLWFLGRAVGAEYGAVIRMTPSGSTIAVYPLASGASVITTGADGMIWFGEQNAVGRLDPSVPPTS